ncbi:MAG: recombinase RecT [Clostridia bacterium]|nr:recombinase RecT [Clostridia bacterium]
MNMSNAVAVQAQKPKFSAALSTTTYQKLIDQTIRDPKKAARFVSAITSAVSVNPQLQDCDPGSILSAAFLGESLDLSPSPQLGQYYLVPFNDRKTGVKKAQFVLGYKGYIQLAIRSGQYRDIEATEIKEGEYLGRDSMTGQPKFQFIEDDEAREAAPVVGYMAYFEYLNGFRKCLYWSREKVMAHADKYSMAFSIEGLRKLQNGEVPDKEMWKYSSYWYKDFDGMAKKTLIRQLISKWGIMSIDMQEGYVKDSGMIQMSDGEFTATIPEGERIEPQPVEAIQPPPQQEPRPEPQIVPGYQVNLADL